MAPGRVQHQNDLVCGSMILEVAAELFHGFLHKCMIVPGGIFAPKTEAFWDVWSNFIEKLDRELALVSNEDLGELWLRCVKKARKETLALASSFLTVSFLCVLCGGKNFLDTTRPLCCP